MKTKKLGIGNNLLMQDVNAIFHEKVKKEKIYYSYVHNFSDFEKHNKWAKSDFEKHNKWAKLILHLPKSHHWIFTTLNSVIVVSNLICHVLIN